MYFPFLPLRWSEGGETHNVMTSGQRVNNPRLFGMKSLVTGMTFLGEASCSSVLSCFMHSGTQNFPATDPLVETTLLKFSGIVQLQLHIYYLEESLKCSRSLCFFPLPCHSVTLIDHSHKFLLQGGK